MNTIILIFTYIVVTLLTQAVGFAISRAVDYQYPTISLMVFLTLFLAAFYIAWPIAVRIADAIFARTGRLDKTSQA